MSNFRYRSQFVCSYAGQFVKLLPKISIGASGAPTIVANTGMGVASVVRNSAGNYSITLTSAFASLLGLQMVSVSGASAPAAPIMGIVADSVAVAAAPVVQIQLRNLSGAATDPASGEILYLEIDLNRSSLPV